MSESEFETDTTSGTTATATIETDREFKAHIYQQLVELQPYLNSDAQMAVLVQQDNSDQEYVLTLVTTVGEYRIESESKNADLYEAFGGAKRKMVQQLDEWFSVAVDTNERDEQIQSLLAGGHLLH